MSEVVGSIPGQIVASLSAEVGTSATIRELIIRQIVARLETIRTASGYNTDLGNNVNRVQRFYHGMELPACSPYALTETAENTTYGMVKCTMPVRVEAFALFGSVNPAVISEQMLGDLIKCLTAPSWTRSPEYISDLRYIGGGSEEYPESEDTVVGTHADFIVVYETENGDPYSQ